MKINITHIDTACILLEINGYRILTDPALDQAGKLYHHGYGSFSRKTDNPAVHMSELNNIDLILLSHHQHKDNFDTNGRKFAESVSTIISTKPAAVEMQGIIGLDDWESHSIETNRLRNLKITATPAQHHPWWLPEFFSGKVIGFVIEFDEQRDGVIYISGDTVYFKGIDEVGRRFKVNTGIFHVGSVQFRYLTGFGKYTMDSDDLIKAVTVLRPDKIIPIHHKGWTHFKEKEADLKKALAGHDELFHKTIFLRSGMRHELS